ncbi:MAG: alpha-amylase family glycosyl hydrolase [Candidatus Gastranaerophilales bacterium]|nr:alpha-amylase family glycosyl hydrolase [Candidatus Gastranaerophilales bacterium]
MNINPLSFKDFISIKQNIPEIKGTVNTVKTTTTPIVSSNQFITNYAQMLIKRNNITPTVQIATVNNNSQPVTWKNTLRTKFINNDVNMYAMIMRTFNAKDKNGNELIEENEEHGTFRNAVERLDEIKKMGINTFHVLPINPPGKIAAKGTAGSVYAPADFLTFDPMLGSKDDFKYFVDECHKRGISVMVDLPSCVSVDLYTARPDLMAIDEHGLPEVPSGWEDIRMFAPYSDKDKKILNKPLVDYHKQFVDLMLECKVDGIRADVARAKPAEFWDEIISYARSKDPEFAFLAETYVYEDASPILNMPHDRPEELLAAGFDSYYGQYHLLPLRFKAKELTDYVIDNLDMTYRLPKGKSLIASFATHDDKSPMAAGGVNYCNLSTGLAVTLPMTNPYFVSGFESGDTYNYSYENKLAQKSYTDSFIYETPNHEHMDIFNMSRKPGGKHPEIGQFVEHMLQFREKYKDVITKGSFIPIRNTGDEQDRIISYMRHINGKTLLIIANRDVNSSVKGQIKIRGLKANQRLVDLAMPYGEQSKFSVYKDTIDMNLGPARFHVFEIDTPQVERFSKEVYKQNLN